jgi:hypothetical protein
MLSIGGAENAAHLACSRITMHLAPARRLDNATLAGEYSVLGGAPMQFVAKVDHGALPDEIRDAFFGLIQSIWKHGKLDPQIREMIRMRSAMLADCKQ